MIFQLHPYAIVLFVSVFTTLLASVIVVCPETAFGMK
jgi:hypothetical protein